MADPVTTPVAAGLINASPAGTNNAPGTTPAGAGPGAAVTGYNPATATAATAPSTAYNPNAFTVTPNQTVAGQIQNIIASGSPLMQQATANAQNMMNERGLINSSQAITAGQGALYTAATPIATADANTYAAAATNTTQAANTAAAANAAAASTAQLQTAAGQTSTSQFNTGQTNAALSGEAAASNTIAQQAQSNAAALANIQANGVINTQITNLTDANKTLLQTSAGAAQIYNQALTNLSNIITNPNLSADQQATALNDGVAQLQDALNILSAIAGTPDIQSTLTFSNPTGGTGTGTTVTGQATGAPATTPGAGSTTVASDGNVYTYNGASWVSSTGAPMPSGVTPGTITAAAA